MKNLKTIICVVFTVALAACADGGLTVNNPERGATLQLDFPPGRAVAHQLPFKISGGLPPYRSSIDGCPDWVTLLSDQGILTGTGPDEDQGESFFCTYRVTESDPGFRPQQSVSRGLRLTVGSVDALSLSSPTKLSLTVGTYHGAALPAASGGKEPYTYSFDCVGGELPSGMGFAPETRVFAGTPDARFRDSCTYTATDSSEPAVTVSRGVEVEVSSHFVTPLSLSSPAKLSLTVGTYHGAALPAAAGGIGPYMYSFTCAGGQLPSGMGFAPETRVFAGTPDAPFRDSCTYTVTDSSQPAVTVSRGVEVEVSGRIVTPLSLPSPAKLSLIVGTYHGAALPAATGGVGPYSYSLTCARGELPSGMGFASATRVFAGTPDARFRDSCTYTATDSSQPAMTVSRAVEIEVSSRFVIPLSLPTPEKLSLTVGIYHGTALPAASGGIGPYTYSFTCAGGELPSGMGFASGTRVFAGTPDARFRDSCTYTATDSSEPAMTVSRAVEVEVSSRFVIPLSLPTPEKLSLTVGTYHGAALPAATGGIAPYTYSFTCAGGQLPSGMSFAPATRMFAGTPDALFRDSCTYTVTDSSQPAMTLSRAVEVEVSEPQLSSPSRFLRISCSPPPRAPSSLSPWSGAPG